MQTVGLTSGLQTASSNVLCFGHCMHRDSSAGVTVGPLGGLHYKLRGIQSAITDGHNQNECTIACHGSGAVGGLCTCASNAKDHVKGACSALAFATIIMTALLMGGPSTSQVYFDIEIDGVAAGTWSCIVVGVAGGLAGKVPCSLVQAASPWVSMARPCQRQGDPITALSTT